MLDMSLIIMLAVRLTVVISLTAYQEASHTIAVNALSSHGNT